MHLKMIPFFLITLLSLLPLQKTETAFAQDAITVTIPEETIAKSVKAALPFTLNTKKLPIKGKFTIVDISNLHIKKDAISCKMKLAGDNMALSANLGGRKINLHVGTVQLHLDANTLLKFDAKKQTIYLRPIIKNAQSNGSGRAAQIAPTLVALLDGQQFPITLKPLQPAHIETSSKKITVKTKIVQVKPKKGKLQLQLLPIISSY